MSKGHRSKSIIYKRAIIGGAKGVNLHTLQSYLDSALKQKSKAASRIEVIGDFGAKRLISSVRRQNNMLFGQMIAYEEGKDQTVVVLDPASDEFPIEQFEVAARKDGKKQEVLESVLYFGVFGDHMVLAQSQALRARDFENHVQWLVSEHTNVFPEKATFMASDQPTKSARDEIEKLPVKSVVIGMPLESEADTSQEGSLKMKAKKVVFHPVGKAFDILTAALGPDWRNGVKLKEALDESNIYVSLEVSYFRKTTERSHEVLDNIAQSLRHLEPDDVKIKLEGGATLTGKDLKMQGAVSVLTNNGVVDASDIYTKMHTWLSDQIKHGLVG